MLASPLASLLVRLKALVFRRATDAELDEELRYHLEREAERNMTSGMSSADAYDAARRAFGNPTVATENARDASRWRLLEELKQDLSYALRTFRRAPIFVATVVATIGLGLGLLTTAFTLFDAYVLRPSPVFEPTSLYEISWQTRDGKPHRFTGDQLRLLQARRDVLAESYAHNYVRAHVRGVPSVGQFVSGNYFQVLGVKPALGRVLGADDSDAPGGSPVMVLSYDTWKASFGADSSVIGSSISINGIRLRIVGVARESFGGIDATPIRFWIPITMIGVIDPSRDPYGPNPTDALRLIGRLRHGVSEEQARTALMPLLRAMTADLPASQRATGIIMESRATPIPITNETVQVFTPLGIAFGLVMLIACANVANIMLARGMARQREIGIRLALGASRQRLIRQLLTESILLSVPSAVAAFGVSRAALGLGFRMIQAAAPVGFRSYLTPISLASDARVAGFMLIAAVVAAVLFGLAPAIQATRPSVVQATRGDFDSHLRPSKMRGGLVMAQITVSALLLICAGILLRTASDARRRDPGVRVANLVQLELVDRRREPAIAELRAMPGVVATAVASTAPLDNIYPNVNLGPAGAPPQRVHFNIVSPEYFGAVDLAIRRGRTFSEAEARARTPVVIVSDATARLFWGNADPLGKHLVLGRDMLEQGKLVRYRDATVIGVAANMRPGWIGLMPDSPTIYYPQPFDAPATVIVRTRGDAEQAKDVIEHSLAAIDSGTVRESHTTQESLDLQIFPFNIAYWIASLVGGIALLLTLTGVYGVVAYVVAQRTRELGVRMALGASAWMMIALVMRQMARLAAVGLVAGLALAIVVTRLMSSVSESVAIDDVVGYLIGIAVVLVASLAAAFAPARRAGRVDPVDALRAD